LNLIIGKLVGEEKARWTKCCRWSKCK